MKFSKLYTGGTFDLFHFGHQNFLRQCRNLSDHVVVALNTDDFVEKFKNKKPILNFNERKKSLLFSPFVDEIVKNEGGEDSTKCILSVRPQIIAVGDDWLHKDYYKQMGFTQQWMRDNGMELLYLPYTKEISSSEIRNRVLSNG
tara:strand:+ start:308 stop:739 length:432 start_codon:yes stop_codon:yes gene_type:complete